MVLLSILTIVTTLTIVALTGIGIVVIESHFERRGDRK